MTNEFHSHREAVKQGVCFFHQVTFLSNNPSYFHLWWHPLMYGTAALMLCIKHQQWLMRSTCRHSWYCHHSGLSVTTGGVLKSAPITFSVFLNSKIIAWHAILIMWGKYLQLCSVQVLHLLETCIDSDSPDAIAMLVKWNPMIAEELFIAPN